MGNIIHVVGLRVYYHWADGIYNANNPFFPVDNILRPNNLIEIDSDGLQVQNFYLVRSEVHDLDGRVRNFWTLEPGRYYYKQGAGVTEQTMARFNFELSSKVKVIYMYQDFSPQYTGRNLNSTTTEVEDDEVEEGGIYKILYIVSQLGGLFIFLIMVLGIIMYPLTNQFFIHNTAEQIKIISDLKLKQLIDPDEELQKPDLANKFNFCTFLTKIYGIFTFKKSRSSLKRQMLKAQRKEFNSQRDMIELTNSVDLMESKVNSLEKLMRKKATQKSESSHFDMDREIQNMKSDKVEVQVMSKVTKEEQKIWKDKQNDDKHSETSKIKEQEPNIQNKETLKLRDKTMTVSEMMNAISPEGEKKD